MSKSLVSNAVAVVMILAGGFVLFNVAFLAYALVISLPLILAGQGETWTQDAPGTLLLMVGILAVMGLAVLYLVEKKLRVPTLLATLLTVPLMGALVFIGIFLYGQSDLLIGLVGAAVIVPLFAYSVWKKVPWVYPLAISYVGILGLLMMIFKVDI